MDESELRSRLSQISTRWSLLREAHAATGDEVARAQAALFERYQGAAYRYLAAILRNPDDADEAFQDFAVRLLRGDFGRATPEKGRFRSYLKTALGRLAVDRHRQRQRAGALREKATLDQARADDPALPAEDFEQCWSTELLENAWRALAKAERESAAPYYAALRYYSEHPGVRSHEIATELTALLQPERPFSADGIRQIVHRARSRFADLLIDEVAASIGSSDPDDLEEELAALQLLDYCRSALIQRRRTAVNP